MLERADTAEAIGLNRSRLRSTRPVKEWLMGSRLSDKMTLHKRLIQNWGSFMYASGRQLFLPYSSSPAFRGRTGGDSPDNYKYAYENKDHA